jgi:hypothetical protein
MAIVFDAGFFASATFPVVIDPWVSSYEVSPHRDGYVQQSTPSTNYESNVNLKVGSGLRSFLRFDMAGITNADRIVYAAQLFLYPTGSGGVTGGIVAKRPTQPLPTAGTLNWNNQPDVSTSDLDTVLASNAPDGWWSWELKELYQHIIDPTDFWNTNWSNNGVRLSASNAKTFYATEAAGSADPVLILAWNDPPHSPNLDTPANNHVTEAESLTLKAESIPGDQNGDDVVISFQISDDGVNWTGSHLVFQSPYDDRKSFTIPGGVLTDGQDYWWRAVSRDICGDSPDELCSLTDGAGTTHTPNSSGVRKITVSLKHFGDDPRYAMWSHDVGSGMTLKVNEANGNLFLDVPLDSYATPVGPLDVGLTYNHQATADYGLGAGWDVAIGPRSGHSALPIALYKLDTTSDADVKIRFRGGRVLYFPHEDKNVYGGVSASSGWVRKSPTNWVYVDGDGGRYVFSLGAENAEGAHLTKAKPAVSQDAAPGKSIDYTYSGTQLTSAIDPLGRKVVLGWTNGKLNTITATGGSAGTSFGDQVWTLAYDQTGRLASIDTVVTIPGSSNRTESVGFTYTSSRLSEVRDGVTNPIGADGWDIEYEPDTTGLQRVESIAAPSGGTPSSTPTPWLFTYGGNIKGTTAERACITDPLGTGTECDAETATDPAFQTQVEFSWAGLPIEVVTPADVEGVRHVSTYVFDNHLNLLCERDPVANAWGGKHCTSATDSNGNYTDLDPDGFSTRYTYFSQAPYRLKSVKQPAAGASAPRLQETYAYDATSRGSGPRSTTWTTSRTFRTISTCGRTSTRTGERATRRGPVGATPSRSGSRATSTSRTGAHRRPRSSGCGPRTACRCRSREPTSWTASGSRSREPITTAARTRT